MNNRIQLVNLEGDMTEGNWNAEVSQGGIITHQVTADRISTMGQHLTLTVLPGGEKCTVKRPYFLPIDEVTEWVEHMIKDLKRRQEHTMETVVDGSQQTYFVHQQGTGEIHRCRTWLEAVNLANNLNTEFQRRAEEREKYDEFQATEHWATPYTGNRILALWQQK